MLLYDALVNYWLIYDIIKPSWKLDGSRWNYWVVWGFCGLCCVRRQPGLWIAAIVWIARPCVPHWADSAELWYEVYECAMCKPFSSNMLCDVMWLILETLDVFKKERSFRKLVLHVWECFLVYQLSIRLLGHLKYKKILNRRTTQLVTWLNSR